MTGRKKKEWQDDDMRLALEACRDGSMTIYGASKQYGVPRMTLSDRVSGKSTKNVGRPTSLKLSEEDSLLHYIRYMYQRRFTIDRSQVIGLAWAIDLKRDTQSRVFGEKGPSLHWWRGFRDRHSELSLRKAEGIDRGRIANADENIIEKYYDVLEETLAKHKLHDRPHLVYNCDESAIVLMNKTSKKVLVPRKSKHCHAIVNASTQHVSVLCCVAAAGSALPPQIVFSKSLPAGRNFQNDGPVNATYSYSDSGFVDRHMYTEWFMKVFLRFAPQERPLLLLQDGASAHLGIELIDAAIANYVILLCFPPKLTHILQPCDVGIYRSMKANISSTMQQIRLLRGDMWINKGKVPAILREVIEKTFTPALITASFRKCGIAPFSRNAISQELIKSCGKEPQSSTMEAPTMGQETIIAELSLDVISPSQVHTDVEVLTEAEGTSRACPPLLALEAIENSLTPMKLAAYRRRDAKCDGGVDDPVYSTWKYLKRQTDGQQGELPTIPGQEDDEHPLLKAGLIPKRLADVFRTPPENEKPTRRGATTEARVLTGEEISSEIRQRDEKRKLAITEREERKRKRLEKKAAKVVNREVCQKTSARKRPPTTVSASTTPSASGTTFGRQAYFRDLQVKLSSCNNYAEMKLAMPEKLPYPPRSDRPSTGFWMNLPIDQVSQILLTNIKDVNTKCLRPV